MVLYCFIYCERWRVADMKLNTVLIYMSVVFHSWEEGSTQNSWMPMVEKEQQMSKGKKKILQSFISKLYTSRKLESVSPLSSSSNRNKIFFLKGGRRRQSKGYHWSWDKHQSAQQGVQGPGSATRAFHR